MQTVPFRFHAILRWMPLLVIMVALAGLAYKASQVTFVYFNGYSTVKGEYRIYWSEKDRPGFNEQQTAEMYVNGRKRNFIVVLDVPLSRMAAIRFDPSGRRNVETVFNDIRLYGFGHKPVLFGWHGFKAFKPNGHVREFSVQRERMRFVSSGRDANVSAPVNSQAIAGRLSTGVRLLIILAFLAGALYLSRSVLKDNAYIPMGLMVAVTSAFAMAEVSRPNAHPDETIHLANAEYYQTHYLPPVVCSPETLPTYSSYGISRLNNRELGYYVGGRVLEVLDGLPASNLTKLRWFNVSLFAFLMLLAARAKSARLLFLPLLLVPQSWYVFSYYNSDAFSLFVVYLMAYQALYEKSLLRRFIAGKVKPAHQIVAAIVVSAVIALQFLVKANFAVNALLLLSFMFAVWIANRKVPDWLKNPKLWLVVLLGVAMFSVWEYGRHARNDFQLAEAKTACLEKTAKPLFHPDTPLEKTHPNVRLKDKGLSLWEMIEQRHWFKRIFFTALGTYGYTEFLNSDRYYWAVAILFMIWVLYVWYRVIRQPGAAPKLMVLATAGGMAGVALGAALIAWLTDFQAQGRYLLGWLPMLGALVLLHRQAFRPSTMALLSLPLFCLAIYSFYAVGIQEIPKVP